MIHCEIENKHFHMPGNIELENAMMPMCLSCPSERLLAQRSKRVGSCDPARSCLFDMFKVPAKFDRGRSSPSITSSYRQFS